MVELLTLGVFFLTLLVEENILIAKTKRGIFVYGNPMDEWKYPEDKRIFDSQMEVYEWTHSLYSEFSNCLFREANVGYATPDEKVIDYLTELLPQWAGYLNVQLIVHKDKIMEDGKYIYRIWTSKVEKFEG